MTQSFGVSALITIMSHLIFILMVWRTLIALRLEKIFKAGHEREIQILMLFIAIGLGYLVSSCFLSLLGAFKNLPYLYK
ncbi:DUF1146 family protein [Lacticaseibacillus sharpeae]|uniref:DUF1146 domain-containing protein n=1 Tax=Lacticaseibacillus sharpeae JCM 1186 = DSM 20505 TaxID=1291052 RepID=A0A0R1ZQ20_9LACO|nr:DUF1146 family protein [Lacticaseibacillus sharpeae]KRM56538.1 hypothetical protein FC18_GL002017 [Lacticaseibacillus sharpeae JCM 1186 = DSM 20505]